MSRQGQAIINFSSTVTRLSIPTYGAYTATKSAVDSLTLILARELRGRDITVNAKAYNGRMLPKRNGLTLGRIHR